MGKPKQKHKQKKFVVAVVAVPAPATAAKHVYLQTHERGFGSISSARLFDSMAEAALSADPWPFAVVRIVVI